MPIDSGKLGVVAAQLMDLLSEDFESDDGQLGEVIVLAEVRGEDEDGAYSAIRWQCSDEREWVQRGLLHAALEGERILEEDEDE